MTSRCQGLFPVPPPSQGKDPGNEVERRPCQYPTHEGGKKAVKTRDVVNVAMAKEILKLHEVVVPIGSGLLSTFSHFYIITLSRRIN